MQELTLLNELREGHKELEIRLFPGNGKEAAGKIFLSIDHGFPDYR